ncbi:MAG: hypothetical protein WAW73_20185 [Rhodoferax sp.]
MNQAKHTPAPWWVTEYGVMDTGGYICHTQPPTHFPGQDERFANEVEERKANATLIAAAPELLDQLKAMNRAYVNLLETGRDRILQCGGTCDPVEVMEANDHYLRDSKAAIAKATGGAA